MQVDHLSPVSTNGMKGIIVDFGARQDRNLIVEQISQLSNDATLGLPAQPQKDQVVARQERVNKLGNDGFFVSDNARKEPLMRLQLTNQIRAHLVFDRSGPVSILFEFA